MVTIGNHLTHPLYDGTIALTGRGIWSTDQRIRMVPEVRVLIPPPESAGDVIVRRRTRPKLSPVAQSVAEIQDALTRNDVVSLSVYPEGMPFAGAQIAVGGQRGEPS